MITLTVTSYNDAPADGTLRANFDELGGTIGRADTNQLVLPDPEKMISRVAAQVVFRNGSFAIVDRGSNPIIVNGRSLGSGREAPLAAGDRLRIGGYELSVHLGASAAAGAAQASVDPFSGLLGPAAPTSSGQLFDPLGGARPLASAPVPAVAAPPAGGIPNDWDPFAPDSRRIDKPSAPARRDALGLEIGGAAPEGLIPDLKIPAAKPGSLDEIFQLGPGSGADPLANSVLGEPIARPNMAADADPVRSLDRAPKVAAASQSDNISDLNRPFIPPTVIKPAPPSGEPPTVSGAVMSWDSQNGAVHTVIHAKVPRGIAPVAEPPVPAPAAPFIPEPTYVGSPGPAAQSSRAAHPSAQTAELLEAFRRGLAAPTVDIAALTPAMMELIGGLLHEAASGTVDLLAARAAFKGELRANRTTIVPRDNNPLKFSPSTEVALGHLLNPPSRGFMAAAPAMRDAYNDLRAHQFGFVAGLQAALEGVLQRFDPATLESELSDKSLLHTLLPSSRKAKLWEVFTQHYARIRADASEDFHNLFGKAFLTAYEEQIDRLRATLKDREGER